MVVKQWSNPLDLTISIRYELVEVGRLVVEGLFGKGESDAFGFFFKNRLGRDFWEPFDDIPIIHNRSVKTNY